MLTIIHHPSDEISLSSLIQLHKTNMQIRGDKQATTIYHQSDEHLLQITLVSISGYVVETWTFLPNNMLRVTIQNTQHIGS